MRGQGSAWNQLAGRERRHWRSGLSMIPAHVEHTAQQDGGPSHVLYRARWRSRSGPGGKRWRLAVPAVQGEKRPLTLTHLLPQSMIALSLCLSLHSAAPTPSLPLPEPLLLPPALLLLPPVQSPLPLQRGLILRRRTPCRPTHVHAYPKEFSTSTCMAVREAAVCGALHTCTCWQATGCFCMRRMGMGGRWLISTCICTR